MNLKCDICVLCAIFLFQADRRNIAKMRQRMFWGRGQPQPHSLLSWSLERTLYSQSTTSLPKEKKSWLCSQLWALIHLSVPGRLPCCDGGTKYSSLLSGNVGTSFTSSVLAWSLMMTLTPVLQLEAFKDMDAASVELNSWTAELASLNSHDLNFFGIKRPSSREYSLYGEPSTVLMVAQPGLFTLKLTNPFFTFKTTWIITLSSSGRVVFRFSYKLPPYSNLLIIGELSWQYLSTPFFIYSSITSFDHLTSSLRMVPNWSRNFRRSCNRSVEVWHVFGRICFCSPDVIAGQFSLAFLSLLSSCTESKWKFTLWLILHAHTDQPYIWLQIWVRYGYACVVERVCIWKDSKNSLL